MNTIRTISAITTIAALMAGPAQAGLLGGSIGGSINNTFDGAFNSSTAGPDSTWSGNLASDHLVRGAGNVDKGTQTTDAKPRSPHVDRQIAANNTQLLDASGDLSKGAVGTESNAAQSADGSMTRSTQAEDKPVAPSSSASGSDSAASSATAQRDPKGSSAHSQATSEGNASAARR